MAFCSLARNPRPYRTYSFLQCKNIFGTFGRGTWIWSFGNSYTIPVRLASAGRALYYEVNCFLRNLLPAADLKYFSLLMASFSVSNFSKYISLKGIKGLIDSVIPELC
jgi:hypothetical protein